MPGDFEIQAYSGSTSEEKLAITSQWEKKKLKTVTIQNGTNNVLKHKNQTVEKMFQHHQDLIKQIQANHELQKVLLCEIPPIFNSENLSGWNEKIDAFNHMLTQRYEHNECYQIIPLNALLASKKNMTANYHKSSHLNNAWGTLFLQNLFLFFLLTHSENILGVRKRANMSDPRDNVVYAETSNSLRANNAKPYRSHNYSNYDYNSYQPNCMHQNDT